MDGDACGYIIDTTKDVRRGARPLQRKQPRFASQIPPL